MLDVLGYAFSDFNSNKFKTLMSSLGIIIGVMAIIVMLTLGDGLYRGVSDQFGDLELDTMYVLPMGLDMGQGGMARQTQKVPAELTDRDVTMLANTPGVLEVDPQISLSATVTYKGTNRTATVSAIMPQYQTRLSHLVDKGRYLSQSDKYSVVLGYKMANGTFDKDIRPGSSITLTNPYTGRSQDYIVVGVMQERNASFLTGDPNSAIYMTKAGLKAISDQDTYTMIGIRAESVEATDKTAENVRNTMKQLHRNQAYTVLTQKMFSDAITQIFGIIKYTLAGIGAVSLLVGGIGILNVMMLTVKERVKEIGLMKAVGATTGNVRLIFIMEAGLLGFISSVIGITLSMLISSVVGGLIDLPMSVSWQNILVGVGFGLLTTLIAGVYPANQAAKLDPIEALRTE